VTLGKVTVNSNGRFSLRIEPLKADKVVEGTVKDKAGHVSAITKVIVNDVIAPTAPIVNAVDNRDKVVSGKTEAGAKVTIKANGKVLATTMANANGNFTATTKAQKAGTVIEVTAEDKAGNTSKATKVIVK